MKKVAKWVIKKLPFRIQKLIYSFWYQLNRPILDFFEVPISTFHLSNSTTKNIKLVGFLKIHNEASTGNLERVLKHMSKFCDDIVVCDCESTDNSIEITRKFTSHIISDKNDILNELSTKQKMLDYVLRLKPDWVVWLDADEVFDREGELGEIRELCLHGEKNGIDGFSFLEYNLWENLKCYRVDELWNKGWFTRLWKNNGFLKFDTHRGLHRKQYPEGLKNIRKSKIKVVHYGFSTPELIRKKYNFYKKHGQSGFFLKRFEKGSGIKTKPFDIDCFPLSHFKISVISLVYKSTKYIDFVWQSFKKYTKNADFLFVANDATKEVKEYLRVKNLPHFIFENKDKSEYYLNRVYRAWNYGGFNAPGDIIVFVNSDMAFSKNWLENLLKNLNQKRIICSRLVESGKLPSGQYAISKDFGKTYKQFRENEFEEFAENIKQPEIKKGGLFMPCAIYKDLFVKSGGYPIGNRKEKDGSETSGDFILFYERLKPMGVQHYTSFDSIVYHIQEGELDE